MNQPVLIKGVRSGLVLKLDSEMDFEELKPLIKDKFSESESFFGSAHMVLSIEGRNTSEKETGEILDIIKDTTKLQIEAVVLEDEELEKKFSDMIGPDPGNEKEIRELKKTNADLAKTIEQMTHSINSEHAEIHAGTLRSGSDIVTQGSIVILGDVKPGATVTAGGSIFVMGALQGTADAGAYGDSTAFVMALNMDPLQIRISDAMAISQDKSGKRKRGFMHSKDEAAPEAALISGGHIVIIDYDSSFLKNCRFFEKDKEDNNGGNING